MLVLCVLRYVVDGCAGPTGVSMNWRASSASGSVSFGTANADAGRYCGATSLSGEGRITRRGASGHFASTPPDRDLLPAWPCSGRWQSRVSVDRAWVLTSQVVRRLTTVGTTVRPIRRTGPGPAWRTLNGSHWIARLAREHPSDAHAPARSPASGLSPSFAPTAGPTLVSGTGSCGGSARPVGHHRRDNPRRCGPNPLGVAPQRVGLELGRNRIRDRYTFDAMIANFTRVYDDILSYARLAES